VRKLNLFLLMLLLQNLTASYAQTGKQNPDTVRCYGLTELQYIAATMVEARACDTLLTESYVKLANRDTLIYEKNKEIADLYQIIQFKDKILILKEDEIMQLTEDLRKEKVKLKWTKLGWLTTTGVLGVLVLYFGLK
jgi:hypothetical protein